MNHLKKIIMLLSLIFVVSACGSNTGSQDLDVKEGTGSQDQVEAEAGSQKNKGVMAPAFSLRDMEGNQVSLADLQGEKVYLKFWASWCHYCTQGMPELTELVEEDNDFVTYTIVAPEFNREYSEEDFKAWYEKQGYSKNIKVLFDENGATMKAYGISGYPTNAFIGSDGILVSQLPGLASNDAIKTRMEKIQ